MTPTSEDQTLDGRLRVLERSDAATQASLKFILDSLREQVRINERLADNDERNKGTNSRATMWAYIVGFIGAMVGIISLTTMLVRGR